MSASSRRTPRPGRAVSTLYRSAEESAGFALNARGGLRATIGETLTALDPGRLWSWSGETVEVRLFSGSLVSRSDAAVLAGKNALAIEHSPGAWEVLQFANADLVGDADLAAVAAVCAGNAGPRARAGPRRSRRALGLCCSTSRSLPVDMTAAEVRRPFFWRYGPAGKDPEGQRLQDAAPIPSPGSAAGRSRRFDLTARADGRRPRDRLDQADPDRGRRLAGR